MSMSEEKNTEEVLPGTAFLGIDLGTSSVKLLLTAADGEVLAEASASYPVYGREDDFYEQRPQDWTDGIINGMDQIFRTHPSIHRAVKKGSLSIAAIGLSAQMPTLVLADQSQNPMGNAIVWCDNRAADEGRQLLETWGAARHYECTGVFLDGRYLVPMYLWLKNHQPERIKGVDRILSAGDYLYTWLTGQFATSPSSASGYGVYDLSRGDWNEDLIREAGISMDLFPPVLDSFHGESWLKTEIREKLGLSFKTRVILGGADSVVGVYGMGGEENGTVCLICGSSTAIIGIREKIELSAKNRFFVTPLLKAGTFGMEADILSSGNTMKWLLDRINEMRAVGNDALHIKPLTHKDLSYLADKVPPGAEGVLFTPYLSGGEQGVLWDDSLSGSISGFNLSHGLKHIARACYEGICFEIYRCLKAFEADGYQIKNVLVAGPVSTDSVFMDILAQILGVTCTASPIQNASALGAALLARQGWRIGQKDVSNEEEPQVQKAATANDVYFADPSVHKAYDEIFQRYAKLTQQATSAEGVS